MSTIKETNITPEEQEIPGPLNAVTRKIYFTINNNTDQNLCLSGEYFVRGHFEGEKPNLIEKGSTKKFTVSNTGDRGLEGSLVWKGSVTLADFKLSFNKPAGSGKSTVTPTAPAGYGCTDPFEAPGHEAKATVDYWKK